MDFRPPLYHYLDRDGIESLYSQTVSMIESTFKESAEKSKSGKITGKAALGQALMGFLKLGEAGVEAESARSKTNTTETTYSLSIEQKLRRIHEYLESYRGDFYFDNLKEAAKYCNENGKSVYISTQARFNIPQFCTGGGGFEAVQKDGAIIFEIGEPVKGKVYYDTYNDSDSYYKDLKVRLVMIASLDKFRTMRGSTSHAACNLDMNGSSYKSTTRCTLTTRSSRPDALRLLYEIIGILAPVPAYQCRIRAAGGRKLTVGPHVPRLCPLLAHLHQ